MINVAVADPGFPRGGAPTPGGAPTYDFVNFRRKLHENEEILAARGGGARVPCAPPLDPPLVGVKHWNLLVKKSSKPKILKS